jgi:hypothetical protein
MRTITFKLDDIINLVKYKQGDKTIIRFYIEKLLKKYDITEEELKDIIKILKKAEFTVILRKECDGDD